MPITTAAENNIEVDDGYERAVCVYVRALSDERVRASKCFDQLPPSPPPPPPVPRSRMAQLMSKLVKIKDDSGQPNTPDDAVEVRDEETYRKEHEAQTASQLALLDRLSEQNFQLRTILGNIRNRISSYNGREGREGQGGQETPATPAASTSAASTSAAISTGAPAAGSYGRRLWERSSIRESHALPDNVIATEAFGSAPITGVTIAECQSLCHAIENDQLGTCKAIAFARNSADPRDLTLRQCYLLRQIGGCSPGTFAGAVFLRRDTDVKITPPRTLHPPPFTCT